MKADQLRKEVQDQWDELETLEVQQQPLEQIDSDRQWLIVQVEHIHQKEERIPRIHARISIESLFPFWTSFIRKLSKNAILPNLSEVVAELWILDESMCYNANPFHNAIAQSKIGFVKMIIDCGVWI